MTNHYGTRERYAKATTSPGAPLVANAHTLCGAVIDPKHPQA